MMQNTPTNNNVVIDIAGIEYFFIVLELYKVEYLVFLLLFFSYFLFRTKLLLISFSTACNRCVPFYFFIFSFFSSFGSSPHLIKHLLKKVVGQATKVSLFSSWAMTYVCWTRWGEKEEKKGADALRLFGLSESWRKKKVAKAKSWQVNCIYCDLMSRVWKEEKKEKMKK